MKLIQNSMMTLALSTIAFCGCSKDDAAEHHFDNKLFINVENPVEEMVFKNGTEVVTETRELVLNTALQADQVITAKFAKNLALVNEYNTAFYTEARALPDEMCSIENSSTEIAVGSTVSDPVTITFTNLQKLNRDSVYVMPVEVVDVAGIDILQSKSRRYFVFKGASLINVVADIAQNNLPVRWTNPSKVSNLKAVTVEALIRVRDFGNVGGLKGEAMSTLFGIEGKFLVRFGDAGFPQNQLQLVNPNGNFPEGNSALGLPTGKWVHVAAVWDATTGDRIIYTDGEEIARDKKASGTVNLNADDCYIGKAWNDDRWLDGEVSELRVWSVQRTKEEIANNIYGVDPASENLVAYWKFDEGTGKTITDHSGNGNTVTAVKDLKWTKVALPEKK